MPWYQLYLEEVEYLVNFHYQLYLEEVEYLVNFHRVLHLCNASKYSGKSYRGL